MNRASEERLPGDSLAVAKEAARVAGRILVAKRSHAREIRFKGRRDIVTDADLAANAAIRKLLEREFPRRAILSEEDAKPPRGSEYVWIVDPLDGTTNYARNYPIYTVSIALARRGRAQVGVVYDPLRDECFSAERNGGAFLNDAPATASKVEMLEDAIIGFELARDQELRERGLVWFAQLASRSMTGRIGGSAALSLCYVGAGRLDGYLHLSLSAWDVAAGMLFAREAGARVTHLDGRAATLQDGAYLAGNRKIFPALLGTVRALNGKR